MQNHPPDTVRPAQLANCQELIREDYMLKADENDGTKMMDETGY